MLDINLFQYHQNIFNWYEDKGRKDFPWQDIRLDGTIDPYSVWVSEIMLQQTQVSTVISYFQKFMTRFPSVKALAEASQDEVMRYWAGLGYYARCRNLHKSAVIIMDDYDGLFPDSYKNILSLPGIGRSTASAILSIAYNKSYAILDGNVKRVLSRLAFINDYIDLAITEKNLWKIAEFLMPKKNTRIYTQSMMDIGATICIRNKPLCLECPLKVYCKAYDMGRVMDVPRKKPKKARLVKKQTFYLYRNVKGEFFFQRNPNIGIWGGLYSLPYNTVIDDSARNKIIICENKKHLFTHFELQFSIVLYDIGNINSNAFSYGCWFSKSKIGSIALPSALSKYLLNYFEMDKEI